MSAGDATNLAAPEWPKNHNCPPKKYGPPDVAASTAAAKFEVGNGRTEEIRLAADVPMETASRRGEFANFLADADIPALLRKGILEASEGKLDSPENCLRPAKLGIRVPQRRNAASRNLFRGSPRLVKSCARACAMATFVSCIPGID